MDAVKRTVEQQGIVTSDLNYIEPGNEPDTTGSDQGVKLPVFVIQPLDKIALDEFNTDRVGYVTDSDGNQVGRIYHSEYRLDLQLSVWVAEGSKHDVDEIGNDVWHSMYYHDEGGPGNPLPDANGNPVPTVFKFRVQDGTRDDDLTRNMTLRRWHQDVAIWAAHEFKTTEDYIATVEFPDTYQDTDGDGMVEAETTDTVTAP